MSEPQKAVVLLSGGLDSTTVLAMARDMGFACYALSVSYGQRHDAELAAAQRIASQMDVTEHRIVTLDMGQFGGSALTDEQINVPVHKESDGRGIPVTYVPARNTVLLSLALGWAEVLNAWDIFIGVNAVDYSGYPDCRPEFIEQFRKLSQLATQQGVEQGKAFEIHTPLIEFSKAQIIRMGHDLGVDYSQTVTCYRADPQGLACGQCDACALRKAGFAEASIADQTRYWAAST